MGGGGKMAAVLEVEVGGPVERDVEEVEGALRAPEGGAGRRPREGRRGEGEGGVCGAGGSGLGGPWDGGGGEQRSRGVQ